MATSDISTDDFLPEPVAGGDDGEDLHLAAWAFGSRQTAQPARRLSEGSVVFLKTYQHARVLQLCVLLQASNPLPADFQCVTYSATSSPAQVEMNHLPSKPFNVVIRTRVFEARSCGRGTFTLA